MMEPNGAKMRVHIQVSMICECGYHMFYSDRPIHPKVWTVYCNNAQCKQFEVLYEVPTVELRKAGCDKRLVRVDDKEIKKRMYGRWV